MLEIPRRTVTYAAAATAATVGLTGVHHFFRLGPEVLAAAIVLLLLPPALPWALRTRWGRAALWAYAAITGLIVVWFGIIDGFLDHVFKALGLANTTFLPGGDAEVVPTFYSLWSPGATAGFYEGTGVLTFVASVFAVYFGIRLVRAAYPRRRPA